MPSIEIFLLKSPQLLIDSRPCRLPYQKAEALLYYLAVEKKTTRERAASLLWDNCDEATARKNLRHAVYTIKKSAGAELILPCGRQELILNRELSVISDYDRLLEECPDVYQGEFMTGFYIKNTPAFEEWMLGKRQFALHTYLDLLLSRMNMLPSHEVGEAERLFTLYTSEEPLDESIYKLMMERYLSNGLYYKGIKLYNRLSCLFEKELSASPGKDLQTLHQRLFDTLHEEGPLMESAGEPLPEREKELAFLSEALRRFMEGSPTSILLSGEDGSGKTYLADFFTRALSRRSFLVLQASCLETEKDVLLKPVSTMILQLKPLLDFYRLKVDLSCLEATSRLFPLSGTIDTSALGLLFRLFFSVGEQIPLVLYFDNIHFMDSASQDFISLLIRGRNPNILFLGTVLPSCDFMNAVLRPLGRENLLLHLEILPVTAEHGLSVEKEAPHPPGALPLADRLSRLTTVELAVLELLSACQSRASLGLFEDLLRENTLDILDGLEHLKALDIIEEKTEQQTPYVQFRNNSLRKNVYERMSPSKRCYFHKILAEHLKHLERFGASDYECLIYHYCHSGNQAMELKYRILALVEYAARNYELYPLQVTPRRTDGSRIPSFTDYCDILEDRLLSLPENEAAAIHFSRLYALVLRTKAQYCIAQGEYHKGLASQKKALMINAQTDQDPLMRIRCLRLVNFYRLNIWNTGDLERSLTECLKLGKEGGYEEDYAIDCRLYGLFQAMEGNYAASLRYLKRSLRIFAKYPLRSRVYTLNIAGCYNYMGEVWRKQKQFTRAIQFYEKAIGTCEAAHYSGNAVFYSNLGRALLALGKKEESADALYHSNRLFNESDALIGRSITKGYVSILEAEKGRFESAKELIKEAVESARLLNSPNSLGLLALASRDLLLRFPEEFSSILPLTPGEYEEEAVAILQHIPGAYEVDESFRELFFPEKAAQQHQPAPGYGEGRKR